MAANFRSLPGQNVLYFDHGYNSKSLTGLNWSDLNTVYEATICKLLIQFLSH